MNTLFLTNLLTQLLTHFFPCQLFWLLLTLRVPVSGSSSGEAEEVNMVVEDVLGPLEDGERAAHWSLLHYSINLNPALREQIATDVESYVSSSELMRINDKGETVTSPILLIYFFKP